MSKVNVRAAFRSFTAAAVLASLLTACGGGDSGSTVSITAYDLASGKTFHYSATAGFTPYPNALAEYPQYPNEKEVLDALNKARREGGTCPISGYHSGGLPAIQFEGHLHKSARAYANWLAANHYEITNTQKDHNANGKYPVQRMIDAGFTPGKDASFAESLESGGKTAAEVIIDWQGSEDHCKTLFDKSLNWGSVARSDSQLPTGGYYWVFNVASY